MGVLAHLQHKLITLFLTFSRLSLSIQLLSVEERTELEKWILFLFVQSGEVKHVHMLLI